MTTSNRSLYIIAAIVIVVGISLVAVTKPGPHRGTGEQTEAPVAAGNQAANFNLEALDGRTVTLESLRGKIVFLNLWATWCGPCRQEMPSMETLYDGLKNNRDFVMLAVSQDTRGRAAVAPYVEKNGYHFTVLHDPENKVGSSHDLAGVPETCIIDRAGRIVAHL